MSIAATDHFTQSSHYQAVAFHYFESRGKCYLFDVESMRVHNSCNEDVYLLHAAFEPKPLSAIIRQAATRLGGDQSALQTRALALVSAGMLQNEQSPPQVAQRTAPTDYVTFMVNVSQRCNLTCSYCYVNKGHFDYAKVPIPRMPIDHANALVEHVHRQFPDFQIYGFHFYGGEPLLNFKAIREIVMAAEAKATATGTEADYHITTNGTLLTPAIADFMADYGFTVYYSIDSDATTHDELRKYVDGRGSYQDVVRNLQMLREREGIHLIGSSVVREANCLSSAISCLAEFGAAQCKAERVRLQDNDPLVMADHAWNTYVADIRDLADHYIEHISEARKPLDYRLTSKILQLLTQKRRDFFCPAGERMFGVAANGELYPCSLHVGRPTSLIGTVESGLDPSAVEAFRHRFSVAGQEACRSCWNRTLCGGGCSAMVDRFGHEKCDALRAESEAAIIVYQHFATADPMQLLALVSPKIVLWANGDVTDDAVLAPTEPAAKLRRQHSLD